jgi:hypothetical protein
VHTTSSTQSGDRRAEQDLLSRSELHRLTLFKWRYSLESMGFDAAEVDQLMFLTWLQVTSRVRG